MFNKNDAILKLLQRRTLQTESEFKKSEGKQYGLATGYIASRTDDKENYDSKYMLKHANKPMSYKDENFDCIGVIHEIITSAMYQRFMYKRAPFIVPVMLKANPYLIRYTKFNDIKFPESEIYAYFYNHEKKLLHYAHIIDGKVDGSTPGETVDKRVRTRGLQKIDCLPGIDLAAFIEKLDPSHNECKKLDDIEINAIELQTGHVANRIGIASEFLQGNFTTVEDYKVKFGGDKLANVEGAEKLFATMLMLGESDINPNNIGVMIENDVSVYAKIDHGMSAVSFFTSPKTALLSLIANFKRHKYTDIIPLNLTILGEAIDQICCISDDEIKELVLVKVLLLQQMKIDIKKLFLYESVDLNQKSSQIQFDNFEALANHFAEAFIKQLMIMKAISKQISVITAIDVDSNEKKEWANGKWLQRINAEEPITWAIKNNKTMGGGENPIAWVANNIIKYIETSDIREIELLKQISRLSYDKEENVLKNKEPIKIDLMVDGLVAANDIKDILVEVMRRAGSNHAVADSVLRYCNDHSLSITMISQNAPEFVINKSASVKNLSWLEGAQKKHEDQNDVQFQPKPMAGI